MPLMQAMVSGKRCDPALAEFRAEARGDHGELLMCQQQKVLGRVMGILQEASRGALEEATLCQRARRGDQL